MQKISDKHFVPTEIYADALVVRIPPRKSFDVMIEAFNRRTTGRPDNTRLFVTSLLKVASVESQVAFWKAVSDILEEATGETDIRTAVAIVGENWPKLSEVARLRIENVLIASIKEGEYDANSGTWLKGGLGAWGSRVSEFFLTRKQLIDALAARIGSDDLRARDYVLKYFVADLFDKNRPLDSVLAFRLKRRLDADDHSVHAALGFVGSDDCDKSWTDRLDASLKKFRERNGGITDEDIPF